MATFCIDTSTTQSFCALFIKGRLKKYLPLLGDRTLSSHIHSTIQKFLKSESFPIEQIFVGLGPGSFTGTRIGIVIAKTLAYSHQKKIPIHGFCSLELACLDSNCFALLDAKSLGVYSYHQTYGLKLHSCFSELLNVSPQFYSLNRPSVKEKIPLKITVIPPQIEKVVTKQEPLLVVPCINNLSNLHPIYPDLTK